MLLQVDSFGSQNPESHIIHSHPYSYHSQTESCMQLHFHVNFTLTHCWRTTVLFKKIVKKMHDTLNMMQYRSHLFITFLFIALAGTDTDAQKVSYAFYRLGGPIISGDTRIEEDGDYKTLDVRATVVPATATNPEVIQLIYTDKVTQKTFSALLTTVPQNGPYSVEKGSPYVIHVHDDANRYVMSTSLISMHITKLKLGKRYAFGSFGIKEVEANFTGKVHYIDLNNQSAEPIEHFIDGNLYYKSRM